MAGLAVLADLTGLTHLYLAGNQLTGCLPTGWQSLDLVGEGRLLLVGLDFCLHCRTRRRRNPMEPGPR